MARKKTGDTLTRTQIELIQHRLSVPECVIDALEEQHTIQAVNCGLDRIQSAIDNGAKIGDLLAIRSDGAAWDALIETMEGSTYLACLNNDQSASGIRLYRAAIAEAIRLEEIFNCTIPRR